MPAPLTTAPAAAPAVVDEVPPAPIVPGEANVNPPVELPDAIRDAAQLAVAHLNITSVEREVRKGRVVYDVKGRDDGRFVEIEIAEDGHVIKIERKDEDEDDDEKKPMPPPVEPNSSETGVF